MELSTILVIFLSIVGSIMSRPHAGESESHHASENNLISNNNNKAAITAYLTESVKDVQYYRREVIRQIELLLRMGELMRQHPTSSERQILVAGLIERLAWTYDQLDKSLDLFVPDESEMSGAASDESNRNSGDDDNNSNNNDDDDDGAANLGKRSSWPKRMYANKYSNIPVIRTGK